MGKYRTIVWDLWLDKKLETIYIDRPIFFFSFVVMRILVRDLKIFSPIKFILKKEAAAWIEKHNDTQTRKKCLRKVVVECLLGCWI